MPAAQAHPVSLPRTTDTMPAGRSASSASIAVALLLLQVTAAAGETVLWTSAYESTGCNNPGNLTLNFAFGLVGTIQRSSTVWQKSTCTPGTTATMGFYSNSAATTLAPGATVTSYQLGNCTSFYGGFSGMEECKTIAQVVIWKFYTAANCSDGAQTTNMAILPLDTCTMSPNNPTSPKIYSVVDGKLTLQTYTTPDCSGTATGGDIGVEVKSQCPTGGCPVDTCLQSTDSGMWNQLTIRGSASGDASIVSKTSGAAATAASGVICALASLIMFLA
jgi:hypothetical protein